VHGDEPGEVDRKECVHREQLVEGVGLIKVPQD
jgi:hypothetical protein